MANPSSFTVTSLTANSSTARPAAQTVDTNGTVPFTPVKGYTNLIMLELVNAAAAALTVLIKAGDNPPALRASQGDLSVALTATGGATPAVFIGPFESGRFIQDDGTVNVNFTAASSTPNVAVRVIQLPKL